MAETITTNTTNTETSQIISVDSNEPKGSKSDAKNGAASSDITEDEPPAPPKTVFRKIW
eukprot:CAMPEP_0198279564 /NCGR_PEP_ID=MMETSP1447-20131203/67001_1 /TAXON_ID=420782 /ORGANISM="Chaetoceros dichaeta, Strain CCMP1751" /LENGTH=58 /DNA_ID=CAMNT_0043974761 /DNA_START=30 /DNA_END=203 /DNA_ORIENTATION=-